MGNTKVSLIFFLALLIACTYKRLDNKSCVVTKDGQGNVQSEIHYINDTTIHGIAKYYYKNGKVKDEINYTNGLKNGIHKTYTREGLLESSIEFKNGIQDGNTYWYHENGKLNSKSLWVNGKAFGDAYYYYDIGVLESYRSFDFEEHNRYLIKYDSSGLKIREEGTVLGQLLLDGDFDSVPLNKNVAISISVATPPNTSTKVLLGEINADKIVNTKELPIRNSEATYTITFNEEGKHKLVTAGELKDLKSNILKRDTIYTDITVIKY